MMEFQLVKRLLFTSLSFVAFLILMIGFSVVVLFFNLDYEILSVGSYIVLILGVALSGFFSAYKLEGKGWLSGLIGGVIFSTFLFVFCSLINKGDFSTHSFIHTLPIIYVVSIISGVIGVQFNLPHR